MSAGILEGFTVSNGFTMTSGGQEDQYYNQNGGGTSFTTVNNCTISRNSANYGGGARGVGLLDNTVNNCIIWDNSASISNNYYRSIVRYSCSYPLPSGEGNISNNPQFISVSNFHLQMTSPCRNAGTNAFAPMHGTWTTIRELLVAKLIWDAMNLCRKAG